MSFPNRTMCEVLGEMRKAFTTYNFTYIPGLIEEVQSMANRMEAGLNDLNDIERYRERRSELSKEIEELLKKRNELAPDKKEKFYE